MKRFWIGIAIITFVILLSWSSITVENRTMDHLIADLDEVQTAYHAKDMEACRVLSERFVERYEQKTWYLPFLMHHDELHAAEEIIATLPQLASEQDIQEFSATLHRCQKILESLQLAEHLSLENIF